MYNVQFKTLSVGTLGFRFNSSDRLLYKKNFSPFKPAFKAIVLRHGQTYENVSKHHAMNTTDITDTLNPSCTLLTKTGQEQAEHAGEKVLSHIISGKFSPTAICVSVMIRTSQTAHHLQNKTKTNLPIISYENLKEIIHAGWTSENSIAQSPKDIIHQQMQGNAIIKSPEGESFLDVLNRVSKLLTELNTTYTGKDIIIISHGLTLSAMHILLGQGRFCVKRSSYPIAPGQLVTPNSDQSNLAFMTIDQFEKLNNKSRVDGDFCKMDVQIAALQKIGIRVFNHGGVIPTEGFKPLFSKTQVQLFRHFETKATQSGILGSSKKDLSNHAISPNKKDHLKLLSNIKSFQPDVIISSPRQDCIRSAQVVCDWLASGTKPDIEVIPSLVGINRGSVDGLTLKALSYDVYIKLASDFFGSAVSAPEGGETFVEVVLRVHHTLDQISKKYSNKRILFVTHQSVIQATLLLMGKMEAEIVHTPLANAAPYWLDSGKPL